MSHFKYEPSEKTGDAEPFVSRPQTMKGEDPILSIDQTHSPQKSPTPKNSTEAPKIHTSTLIPPTQGASENQFPRMANLRSKLQRKPPENEVTKLQRQYSEYMKLKDEKLEMSDQDESAKQSTTEKVTFRRLKALRAKLKQARTRKPKDGGSTELSVSERFTFKRVKAFKKRLKQARDRRLEARKHKLIEKLSDKLRDQKVDRSTDSASSIDISAAYVKELRDQALQKLNNLALKLKKAKGDIKSQNNKNVTELTPDDLAVAPGLTDTGDKKDSLEVVKAILGKSQLFKDQGLELGNEDKGDCDAILKLFEKIEDTKKEAEVFQETAKLIADLKQSTESQPEVVKEEDRKQHQPTKSSVFKGMLTRSKGNKSNNNEEKDLQEQYSRFMQLSWQEGKTDASAENHEVGRRSRAKHLKDYFKGVLINRLSEKFKKIDKVDISALHVKRLQDRVLVTLNRLALKLTPQTSDAKSPKDKPVVLTAADLKEVDLSGKDSHKVVETLLRKSGTLQSIDLSKMTEEDRKDCESVLDIFHQMEASKITANSLKAEARKEADGKINEEIEDVQEQYCQYMQEMEGKLDDNLGNPNTSEQVSGEKKDRVGQKGEKWHKRFADKLSRKFAKFGHDFDVDISALHVEELRSKMVDNLKNLLKSSGVSTDKKQKEASSLEQLSVDDLKVVKFKSLDDVKDFISEKSAGQISHEQLSKGENKELCDAILGLSEQIEISKRMAQRLSSKARLTYQQTMKNIDLSQIADDTDKPESALKTGDALKSEPATTGTVNSHSAQTAGDTRKHDPEPALKKEGAPKSESAVAARTIRGYSDPRNDPMSFAFKAPTPIVVPNLIPREIKHEDSGSNPQRNAFNEQVKIFANRAYHIHILTRKIHQLSAGARHDLREAEAGKLKTTELARLEAIIADGKRLAEERAFCITERDAALQVLGNLNAKYLRPDDNSLLKVIERGNQHKLEQALFDLSGKHIHITHRHLRMMQRSIETSRREGSSAAVDYFLKNLSSSVKLDKPTTTAAREKREQRCKLIISLFEQIQFDKKIAENLKGEVRKHKQKLAEKHSDKKHVAAKVTKEEPKVRYHRYVRVSPSRNTKPVDNSPKASSNQTHQPSFLERLSHCFFRSSSQVSDAKAQTPTPRKAPAETKLPSSQVEATTTKASVWSQFTNYLFGKSSQQAAKVSNVPTPASSPPAVVENNLR
ncbi:MAG TPA: hypothetical protein VHE99_08595 [Gammaproteobacteria bacterium]|nr:hypothetical protein [Gammaproteobacteria bacterium]